MATVAISALPSATGIGTTDTFPIVQGGVTRKVAMSAAFAALPAIGGTTPNSGAFTTISATGLVDISAAGAGQVKFPATQNASANANTLDDYEEGTWTPAPTNLTVVGSPTYTGTYVKVGRCVYVTLTVTSSTSTASTAGSTFFGGLPFTPAIVGTAGFANADATNSYGTNLLFTDGRLYCPTWAATATVYASGFYFV